MFFLCVNIIKIKKINRILESGKFASVINDELAKITVSLKKFTTKTVKAPNIDEREEYSNSEKYPFAEDTFAMKAEDFLQTEDKKSLQRFSDILLLGHDWNIDQKLLLGVLKIRGDEVRPRIGAIGSTSKWKTFKEAAMNDGVNEEWFNSARCPIGIDIGAETPEEIGVAVCAEILLLEKTT